MLQELGCLCSTDPPEFGKPKLTCIYASSPFTHIKGPWVSDDLMLLAALWCPTDKRSGTVDGVFKVSRRWKCHFWGVTAMHKEQHHKNNRQRELKNTGWRTRKFKEWEMIWQRGPWVVLKIKTRSLYTFQLKKRIPGHHHREMIISVKIDVEMTS